MPSPSSSGSTPSVNKDSASRLPVPTESQGSSALVPGAFGLTGVWRQVANMSAIGVIVTLLFILDARVGKMHDQSIEVMRDTNKATNHHNAVIESHIATQIEVSRDNNARLGALATEIKASREATERLEWRLTAMSGFGAWFGLPKDPPPKPKDGMP